MSQEAIYTKANLREVAETLAAVTAVADIPLHDLLSRSRLASLCDARNVTAHILRSKGFSTPAIAAILNRSHAAVLAMLSCHASRYELYREYRDYADRIINYKANHK